MAGLLAALAVALAGPSLRALARPPAHGGAPRRRRRDVDVCVIGGGPAGHTVAALLARDEHSVALVDPSPEGSWPNNYGSWRVEWEALASSLRLPELLDCVRVNWGVTDCYFGGSFDTPFEDRTRLDAPYLQVDRTKLKALLEQQHAAHGVRLSATPSPPKPSRPTLDGSLVHDASGSTVTLEPSGEVVRAKLVVDATGFESRMVARESVEASGLWKEAKPGYQIAYGMCIDAKDGKIGPYDPKAMTLFDYRTDHLEGTSLLADAEDRPSFVYTMPTDDDGVFFEETSLVGRDERRPEFETLRRVVQAPRVPWNQVRRVHRARGGTATSRWAARSPTRRSASSPSEAPPTPSTPPPATNSAGCWRRRLCSSKL